MLHMWVEVGERNHAENCDVPGSTHTEGFSPQPAPTSRRRRNPEILNSDFSVNWKLRRSPGIIP
jgi:hypothetical protein